MLRICRDCKEDFDSSKSYHSKGYIDQCGDYASDVQHYIGRVDNACKSGAGLNIFRSHSAIAVASAVCASECRAGFNANLPVGSTTSTFGEKADC